VYIVVVTKLLLVTSIGVGLLGFDTHKTFFDGSVGLP
jgi:hypothetical protein